MDKLFIDLLRLAGLAIALCISSSACSQEQALPSTGEAVSNENIPQETTIYYHEPAWSPDGSRIAFSSNRDGNFELYTINPDATDLQRLTHTDAGDGVPSWSPDGDRIAFAFNGGIYVMNADGSDRIGLTDTTRASAPEWSPDGAKIAYEGRIDGNWDLFVMNADGSGSTRLTDAPANDFRPAWSPDGTRIAFSSNREGTYDLYVMNADGSSITRLTDAETHETHPAWSSDGGKLLFTKIEVVGDEEKWLGLYVIDLVTGQQTQITAGAEREACWSPDGTQVAYITDAVDSPGFALFTMDADGSDWMRLMPQSR